MNTWLASRFLELINTQGEISSSSPRCRKYHALVQVRTPDFLLHKGNQILTHMSSPECMQMWDEEKELSDLRQRLGSDREKHRVPRREIQRASAKHILWKDSTTSDQQQLYLTPSPSGGRNLMRKLIPVGLAWAKIFKVNDTSETLK